MATTTDMTDNAALDSAIAEQVAVDDLLHDPLPLQVPVPIPETENSTTTTTITNTNGMDIDQTMTGVTDSTTLPSQTQTPQPSSSSTAPPQPTMPSRVSTPAMNGSRAASADTPTIAQKHGAPARQYINEKITPHTLEIIKRLGVEQPDNPLRVLAEFFEQRATELGQ